MKLRNKKTGLVVDFGDENVGILRSDYDHIDIITVEKTYTYHSLAELNEEWEDYTPQEPQEEIGKQLISSPYDKDFYWADEEQQEAFREFCRKEDNRPENKSIPSDLYGDSARFGGVLSGNDRPRNMSEFNAWQNGADFLLLREDNERLGRERWLRFVREHGLEKFVEHKEPLIKDEKVRKAVRAWAEVNRTKYVWVSVAFKGIDITQDFEHLQLTEYKQSISFECEADFKSGTYTITELCGEEE